MRDDFTAHNFATQRGVSDAVLTIPFKLCPFILSDHFGAVRGHHNYFMVRCNKLCNGEFVFVYSDDADALPSPTHWADPDNASQIATWHVLGTPHAASAFLTWLVDFLRELEFDWEHHYPATYAALNAWQPRK